MAPSLRPDEAGHLPLLADVAPKRYGGHGKG